MHGEGDPLGAHVLEVGEGSAAGINGGVEVGPLPARCARTHRPNCSPSNAVSTGSCAQSTRPSDSSHHCRATA
ncbi:hypothetical protein ABZW30_43355 [Kitasatospora sp. NPDC004669]|uniref:hypothetical protein n=1 Tax=Kitasatospora sp. NPDC004669 TaxID=3154555 RepID=UPI0033B3D8ED